jgi:prepilin-type N-terminal cleavage/methylation domain-containing protein
MSYRKHPDSRPGFTLVEMLVAIAIITVIATLGVAVIPVIQTRAKASRGGDLLQGWFLEAKQMALRDRAPRGVRLFVDPFTGFILTGQYIQQPDNITGGLTSFASFDTSTPNPNLVFLNNFDVTGGQGTNTALWPIQIGDYIQIQGGQAHQIVGVNPATATTPSSVGTAVPVWNPALGAPGPTTNYTIIRQPRPIPGENILQFPVDVGINPTLSLADSTPFSTLGISYDIVFTPSGTLTGALGNGFNKLIFWVQDYTQDLDQPGEMPLIAVFCSTGRIGGFQNNYQNAGGNPSLSYIYVLDPRATGL